MCFKCNLIVLHRDLEELLDFKGKAKCDAWDRQKGMSQDEVKEAYINKARLLIDTYGTK